MSEELLTCIVGLSVNRASSEMDTPGGYRGLPVTRVSTWTAARWADPSVTIWDPRVSPYTTPFFTDDRGISTLTVRESATAYRLMRHIDHVPFPQMGTPHFSTTFPGVSEDT